MASGPALSRSSSTRGATSRSRPISAQYSPKSCRIISELVLSTASSLVLWRSLGVFSASFEIVGRGERVAIRADRQALTRCEPRPVLCAGLHLGESLATRNAVCADTHPLPHTHFRNVREPRVAP